MTNLEKEAAIFGASLVIFAKQRKIPFSLFNHPDHLVMKAANIQDFGKLNREEVAPMSDEMFCIEIDKRFKTSAHLKGRIALYNLGFIEWVSVEEPKSRGLTDSTTFCAEFCTDSLEMVRDRLREKAGIRTRITPEKNRAYVSVPIGAEGYELRFTDTPLENLTFERFDAYEALPLEIPDQDTSTKLH